MIQIMSVTVSRLPDSALDELENHLSELHDENVIDSDYMQTFQSLLIGYGAAWDALEERREDKADE